MDFTLILSSNRNVGLDHLAQLQRILDEQNIRFSTRPLWLRPHLCAQIGIDDYLRPDQMELLRTEFDKNQIDIFITHASSQRKKILFCDMEATIIREEILDELAKTLNIENHILPITQAAMAGEIDFQTALEKRVNLLKGTSVLLLQEMAQKLTPNPGAIELLKVLNFYKIPSVLVTGGFDFFASRIAGLLGFTSYHANHLIIENNELTGTVKAPVLDRQAKADFIHRYCIQMQITPDQTAAVGDGANDSDMISLSGMGVGYHPKKALADATLNHIRHTDLSHLLYIFGFTWQDIEKALHHGEITVQNS